MRTLGLSITPQGEPHNKMEAEERKAVSCLQHVQRMVFHDAFEEPNTYDPEEILRMRSGRCGHASVALAYLLDQAGIENRVVFLPKHTLVEAKWNGRWHLLDADLFKHGVVPRKDNGEIPALREVQGNHFIDRFPPTAYVYTRRYKPYQDKPAYLLRPPHFHEPHEAGFISHYYQMNLGLPLEYPPSRPEGLASTVEGQKVFLRWSESRDLDNDLVGYEVLIGRKSRGWNYEDPVYENVPKDTSDKPIFTEYPRLETRLDPGKYYWSVRAIDEHRKKEPRTYYFPSEECCFGVT